MKCQRKLQSSVQKRNDFHTRIDEITYCLRDLLAYFGSSIK